MPAISVNKPTVGADVDDWGDKINVALDTIVGGANLTTSLAEGAIDELGVVRVSALPDLSGTYASAAAVATKITATDLVDGSGIVQTAKLPDLSPTYAALSNSVNRVLAQTVSYGLTDINGGTLASINLSKGCLEVYSQIATLMHDLQILVHGHADVHIARAAPSNRASLVTITGTPTGGTFTLSYGGQTTSALAYNATPTAVQTALMALSSMNGEYVWIYSDTGFTATNGGPWTISLTITDPTVLTASGAGLTGGTSPSVTVSQTVPSGALFIDLPVEDFKLVGTINGDYGPTGGLRQKIGGDGTGTFYWLDVANASVMTLTPSGALTLGTLAFGTAATTPYLKGGGTSGGLVLYANAGAGTSGTFTFRNNTTDLVARAAIATVAPTSGQTVLTLAYHNGTAVAYQNVTLGAADSGGVGFKSLRVPN